MIIFVHLYIWQICQSFQSQYFVKSMAWESGDWMILDKCEDVSHVVGSSKHRGNWKQFWIKHSGRKWPPRCRILGCSEPATVGAHVYVKYSQQIFILPTCQECNRDPDQEYPNYISVKANTKVVRVKRHDNTYETD